MRQLQLLDFFLPEGKFRLTSQGTSFSRAQSLGKLTFSSQVVWGPQSRHGPSSFQDTGFVRPFDRSVRLFVGRVQVVPVSFRVRRVHLRDPRGRFDIRPHVVLFAPRRGITACACFDRVPFVSRVVLLLRVSAEAVVRATILPLVAKHVACGWRKCARVDAAIIFTVECAHSDGMEDPYPPGSTERGVDFPFSWVCGGG
eukprot:scaffold883_cov325-Pavlova_lutheri.AAC.3